jgi:hypothetical protein
MKNFYSIILVVLLLPHTLEAQTLADTTYKPVEFPKGFTAQLNVVYTKVKDWEGKMDIYLPPKAGKGR